MSSDPSWYLRFSHVSHLPSSSAHSAGPDTPVQPVSPVRPVSDQEASQPIRLGPVLQEGVDPAEMAVRMRIRPYEEADRTCRTQGRCRSGGSRSG